MLINNVGQPFRSLKRGQSNVDQTSRDKTTVAKFWSKNLSLGLIILIGFGIRLYRLGAQSLWYDETVSAYLAGQAPFELIAHTARDIHPPGYYLLLHFWTAVAGNDEFALAYLSVIFGVLLIPLTYILAQQLVNTTVARWAALLTAFSPYHIWYSQEVRMYTLGAALGVAAAYWGFRAVTQPATFDDLKQPAARRFWRGYFFCTAAGLYTLYYFAFLLIVLNLLFLGHTLLPKVKRAALVFLVMVNGLVLMTYLPWLPIAWRQATNPPVPPWRARLDIGSILAESWSALSLGQSVEPGTIWPMLLLTLVLFGLGLYQVHTTRPKSAARYHPPLSEAFRSRPIKPHQINVASVLASPSFFLLAYTFGPLFIIYLLSFLVPLYHVRYLFTYAPAFYIVLGAGFVWLRQHTRFWAAAGALSLLLLASLFSIYQLHFSPRYRSDDYRAAVNFIQNHWQPGDAILINAGYTYTAFIYYAGSKDIQRQRLVPYQPPTGLDQPHLFQTGTIGDHSELGWADPQSDFYTMSPEETLTALEHISHDFSRLWMLRAYDTVTDPTGLIRRWLAGHTTLIEDQVFSGESNIRAQGFLLAVPTDPPNDPIDFEDGMTLAGWQLPDQPWQPGQTIHLKLWWMATAPPGADYKMSLKLWTPDGELAAQGQDEWIAGTAYRATAWAIDQTIYHPAQITLPDDLPAGQYWLDVELYHPDTIQLLPRKDGSGTAVTLGPVQVIS